MIIVIFFLKICNDCFYFLFSDVYYENNEKRCNMYNTIQREAVLKVLCESGEHLSADEIYQVLSEKISQLSLATVYRNLKKLEAQGLIREVFTLNQQKKFESNSNPHFHIYCPKCEKITDLSFESLKDADKLLTDKMSEFNCKNYHLEFIAICSDCQIKLKQSPPAPKPPPLSLI